MDIIFIYLDLFSIILINKTIISEVYTDRDINLQNTKKQIILFYKAKSKLM